MPNVYNESVKEFVNDFYSLISSHSPTVPLHGWDTATGVKVMNRLLRSYSGTALMITIPKKIHFPIENGTQFINFAAPGFTDPIPDVTEGRLAEIQNLWLNLDGVDYPMEVINRNVFYSTAKYFPMQSLPLVGIIDNQTNYTNLEIWPGASQFYELWIYGKFELAYISESMDVSTLPDYFLLFFEYACAKYTAFHKGRAKSWTKELEDTYEGLRSDIVAISPINLVIKQSNDNMLNGAYRVRAGI